VNRSCGKALGDEEVRERVCHALGLHEDEGEPDTMRVQDVEEHTTLVGIFDVLHFLRNVLRRRPDTSNRKEDILAEEVAGEHLDVTREGGREHERLAVGGLRHILAFDNAADLRLETHVKHTIGLIEDQILNAGERDAASLYEVNKTTGSGDEQITATLDLAELGADVCTSVDDAGLDPRAVGELARLFVNLRRKLTGWSENQRRWVGFALASETSLLWSRCSRSSLEGLRKNWEQETTSLSGTGLSTSHQVTAAHHDWNRVFLHWRWHLVTCEVDVGDKVIIERWVGERSDGLWHALSGSLHWNIVIFLEVDARGGLRWVVGHTE